MTLCTVKPCCKGMSKVQLQCACEHMRGATAVRGHAQADLVTCNHAIMPSCHLAIMPRLTRCTPVVGAQAQLTPAASQNRTSYVHGHNSAQTNEQPGPSGG